MPYGEPKDVEGQCNARLALADNFGDNHCTMRCALPEGHEGLHHETYQTHASGTVTVHWERHDVHFDIDRAQEELRDFISDLGALFSWDPEDDDPATPYYGECYKLNGRVVKYNIEGKDQVVFSDGSIVTVAEAKIKIRKELEAV